mgnify:CR=1 FL=1
MVTLRATELQYDHIGGYRCLLHSGKERYSYLRVRFAYERNRLVAGRLVGGPGDERCQAAAAAVRRHRGGGGKRGWLA